MSLSLEEKETIIVFNEKDKEADMFVNNRALISRLKKYAITYPDEVIFKSDNGEGGLTFIVPKTWFEIRPPRKRNLTESQKQTLKIRAKKMREAIGLKSKI